MDPQRLSVLSGDVNGIEDVDDIDDIDDITIATGDLIYTNAYRSATDGAGKL
ncbi:MAG: hypothetical protein WCI87_09140 [Euryarchaeota archaeon]